MDQMYTVSNGILSSIAILGKSLCTPKISLPDKDIQFNQSNFLVSRFGDKLGYEK